MPSGLGEGPGQPGDSSSATGNAIHDAKCEFLPVFGVAAVAR